MGLGMPTETQANYRNSQLWNRPIQNTGSTAPTAGGETFSFDKPFTPSVAKPSDLQSPGNSSASFSGPIQNTRGPSISAQDIPLPSSQTGTGSAVGTIAGAGIGAVVGSIIPGAGTIVGAKVGALIGNALGSIYDYFSLKDAQDAMNVEARAAQLKAERIANKEKIEAENQAWATGQEQKQATVKAEKKSAEEQKYQRTLSAAMGFRNMLASNQDAVGRFLNFQKVRTA